MKSPGNSEGQSEREADGDGGTGGLRAGVTAAEASRTHEEARR